jgi:hypothetical protein
MAHVLVHATAAVELILSASTAGVVSRDQKTPRTGSRPVRATASPLSRPMPWRLGPASLRRRPGCMLGAALGHIRSMVRDRNFAPGNAGYIFWYDIIAPLLLIGLYIATR